MAAVIALGSEGATGPIGLSSAARGERIPSVSCSKSKHVAGRPDRGQDFFLGPVAFAGAIVRGGELVADSDDFEREPGQRYTGFKTGAIVERRTTATIVVPRSERPTLKLDYSPNHQPAFRNALRGCKGRRAGFVGGFRVMGPVCTKLRVRVEGRKRPITKPVSFGAGECGPDSGSGLRSVEALTGL